MIELTPTDASNLRKQILTDEPTARIKTGRTNGKIVLHVRLPEIRRSYTLSSIGDWKACLGNPDVIRSLGAQDRADDKTVEREQFEDMILSSIANKEAI